MISLTHRLLKEDCRHFTLSLHSSSLEPGNTPYSSSEEDVLRLFNRTRDYLRMFVKELGGKSRTPTELLEVVRDRSRKGSTEEQVRVVERHLWLGLSCAPIVLLRRWSVQSNPYSFRASNDECSNPGANFCLCDEAIRLTAMRDIALIFAIAVGLGITLPQPFAGVILWTWFSLQNPHQETYRVRQHLAA